MYDKVIKLNFKGKDRDFTFRFYDKNDDEKLRKLYSAWRYLNDVSKELGNRGVNIPEGLSETIFCRAMGAGRIIKAPIGFPKSYDVYNIKKKVKQEIKATSIENDLTSFSNSIRCDELYFVDFYKEGAWDGSFDIYKIDIEDLLKVELNKNQSFEDQQKQKRRPRFSVKEKLIKKFNLLPVYSGKLDLGRKAKLINITRKSVRDFRLKNLTNAN